MKTDSLHTFSQAKTIAFTALFAALCCLGTVCIAIPLPTAGFFNIGDVFVLLSAWCLGPFWGAAAAGVGSALADILLGFGLYAPATFLIKALDAFIAYMVWSFLLKCIKNDRWKFLARLSGALAGELIMIVGYFLFDSVLIGSFVAAAPTLIGNGLQGICCAVLALLLTFALLRVKQAKMLFPKLYKKE